MSVREVAERHWRELSQRMQSHRPPREHRVRESLDLAVAHGLTEDGQAEIFKAEGLPPVVAWDQLSDIQLARISARLRASIGI